MTILSRQSNYTKLDKEDPEEVQRRKAQFLIYKVMEQADSNIPSPRKRRPSSFLRLRLCRLKVKIGKRLKKSISTARIAFHKQVSTQLKTWKRFFSQGDSISTLPPLFN
ncbi:hypothetical protein Dsin_027924 [Dipteronia sinensis]|uniref:Uncharacterized protein n=1 Tax=Dipteronia sinensis TaxID=43782 RepID=A0AAE0DTR2_9ROSI|nr:hypothetical protein Dsin_027924 [Dipteronia sinensis]